ncbi:STAS domain-containing protein [Rhodobacter sp. NSM]|uniref:STAS domain-containing protein n=1 Tax=Rhodobacter sp. NSM TaxID=3457501 RepID=UPI003FD45577
MNAFTLSGDLRLQDAPGLMARLKEALAAGDVEVDASALVGADAAVVQVLVSAAATAAALGRRLVLPQDCAALSAQYAALGIDAVAEAAA